MTWAGTLCNLQSHLSQRLVGEVLGNYLLHMCFLVTWVKISPLSTEHPRSSNTLEHNLWESRRKVFFNPQCTKDNSQRRSVWAFSTEAFIPAGYQTLCWGTTNRFPAVGCYCRKDTGHTQRSVDSVLLSRETDPIISYYSQKRGEF